MSHWLPAYWYDSPSSAAPAKAVWALDDKTRSGSATARQQLYMQPGEVLNVSMDFRRVLEGGEDLVAVASSAIGGSGVTLTDVAITGNVATMTLTAASDAGESARRVTVTVTTTDGATRIGDGLVNVAAT